MGPCSDEIALKYIISLSAILHFNIASDLEAALAQIPSRPVLHVHTTAGAAGLPSVLPHSNPHLSVKYQGSHTVHNSHQLL
jgi:hypothetical protein